MELNSSDLWIYFWTKTQQQKISWSIKKYGSEICNDEISVIKHSKIDNEQDSNQSESKQIYYADEERRVNSILPLHIIHQIINDIQSNKIKMN